VGVSPSRKEKLRGGHPIHNNLFAAWAHPKWA
jgi:hypothetical protein